MKLTSPRQLHPSSVGFLCPIESPEHTKIGLTKQLSLIGSITTTSIEQYHLIYNYVIKKVLTILK